MEMRLLLLELMIFLVEQHGEVIAIMEGKTILHFKVGERVKLASGHDHNAIPAYTTTVPLTEK